jgi:hypothetical protein
MMGKSLPLFHVGTQSTCKRAIALRPDTHTQPVYMLASSCTGGDKLTEEGALDDEDSCRHEQILIPTTPVIPKGIAWSLPSPLDLPTVATPWDDRGDTIYAKGKLQNTIPLGFLTKAPSWHSGLPFAGQPRQCARTGRPFKAGYALIRNDFMFAGGEARHL